MNKSCVAGALHITDTKNTKNLGQLFVDHKVLYYVRFEPTRLDEVGSAVATA